MNELKLKCLRIVICCTVLLLSPMYVTASSQSPAKQSMAITSEENPALEVKIIDFLKAFSAAYKKGDVDSYLTFYATTVIENGLNSLEKIRQNYMNDTKINTISAYDFDIYEIKSLDDYSLIDGAYNKVAAHKETGESNSYTGDVRIKIIMEPDFRIAAIDYNRYIKNEYVVGPEDVLEISVWKSPDLSTAIIVRPDGMISLPLIGEIKAKGRTAQELRDVIQLRLGEYKQDPVVSVIVKEANSHSIYIMGEVARPGKYLLRSETRILQAISLAGGFTPGANKDNIIILRKSLTNPEGNRLRVKYSDIISGKNPEANILIRSGDTILLQPY